MKMEALFTREKANEGTKVSLSYADGTPTDHHLMEPWCHVDYDVDKLYFR